MASLGESVPPLDRREAHRYHYFVAVQLRCGPSTLWGSTTEIGLDGMFVEVATPLPMGTRLRVLVPLVGQEAIWVSCEVRRVVPGTGMAVEFCDLPGAEQEALRALLDRLPH